MAAPQDQNGESRFLRWKGGGARGQGPEPVRVEAEGGGGREGDGSFNPGKRPLEHSPTQAQQPGSPFAGAGPFQQGGARTIYSNKLSFGPPTNGAAPANGVGGIDQDSYGSGMYAGERSTGMGRQASGDGMAHVQGQHLMSPMAPQDAPRKRLRRGGPGGDDTADEGPGSFSANLQNRLAGVHVESGPPSTASSGYGTPSASMAPTPSYGSNTDLSHPQSHPSQPPRPLQQQPGTPPLHPSVHPGMNDPAFQAFRAQAGANFPAEKVWAAWQQGGGDQMRALQALVDAKPATPQPYNPSGSPYAAVNSPLAPAPGQGPPQQGYPPQGYTQQQQHLAMQQQQQQQLAAAQQQGQRPTIQVVRQGPGAQPGYPSTQQHPAMAQRMANGQPYAMGQAAMGGYGSQQQQASGYPPQGGMGRPGMQYAPQSQHPMVQQRPNPMPNPGSSASGYAFPPAEVGAAGMSPAHVGHYYQLQEGYKRGQITADEYRQLTQYINVLNKYYMGLKQQGQPLPAKVAAFYPGGAPGHQAQAYSHNGVYANQPGMMGQQRMAPQQMPQPAKPKIQVPKHHAPLTSGTILARQLALAAGGGGSAKKKPTKMTKKSYGSDSDDDGGDYDSAGSGDEYGSKESPAQVAKREAIAVEFFNDGTKEQLMELAGCNATQATLTMKLRPFATANDFRTRTRKQKGVGNNMMDTYLEVISGMSEVDKVLDECEQIGRELSAVMSIWASGAAASSTSEATRPGATMANDVGLDLVAISEETIATRVDTSQDPRVKQAFADFIRRQPEGVPDNIKLKDYQMLGVNWLNLLYKRGTSCILADEMGLGKTAQVIALLAHLKATDPNDGPHLVIVPSSTLDNWMREFSVFAPNLNVQSYYGSQGDRAEIRHELRRMEDLDVVVTTYNIATGSPDDQKFLKRKMDFKICVFDEGHQLKNSDSKKYKDLMQVRAEWRLLLTGTPLQNNLQELVSLLSFILPEQFRDANESLRAIFKVTSGSQTNLLSRERINRAKKMMTPFVLRRKKAQVLKDLPAKFERIEYCDMTDMQREVYDEAVTRSRTALSDVKDEEELELLGEDDDDEGVDEAPEGGKKKPLRRKKTVAHTKMGNKANTSSSAHVLTDLRKASNHPMLFRRLYDEKKLRAMAKDCLKEEEFLDRNKDLIFEDMEVMTDFELHRFCQGYKHLEKYCLQNNEWMSAGKIHKLQEMLPTMREKGDRVLIFSQFVQVLDILEVVLDTMDMKYLKLTGQTQVADRQGLVDAYNGNDDITVFLLSTRAGGLGLNLTAANTVIFYDCDYNPHNDAQAADRAYRIGQTRDVNVVRLVTKDSLDEAMLALATAKLKLDSEVSGGDKPSTGEQGEPTDDGSAEKNMKKSLLTNLKATFDRERQAGSQTQTQPATVKAEGT
ncbi:hypothetical protein JCM11251_006718 [Rhodosporidiobolus azoricus]